MELKLSHRSNEMTKKMVFKGTIFTRVSVNALAIVIGCVMIITIYSHSLRPVTQTFVCGEKASLEIDVLAVTTA